ncbi:MAG: efflux RND transporter permease subunit [Aulosira sp. DedQUE10]|nr:efflux RND transporter permease subunit [Aulosira sp. DedQUE10]
MLDKVRAIPGLRTVDSDLQLSTPQVQVQVGHAKAATLGITAAQVEKTLTYAYGSSQVSTILYAQRSVLRNFRIEARVPARCQCIINVMFAIATGTIHSAQCDR